MDRAKHKNNSGVGSIRHSNAELIQHYKSVRIVTQILGLDATYSKNPSYCTTVDVDLAFPSRISTLESFGSVGPYHYDTTMIPL